VLRDGHKFLAPYALFLNICAGLGVERLVARLAEPRNRFIFAAMIALPVALTPDLAYGGAGQLRPVAYPADWDHVAAQVAAAPGEVLSLPFSEYHSYPWNYGRTVIDPAPRYLPAEVLADDRLRVGDVVIQGENPRAAWVRDILATEGPVAQIGVRWVLVQRGTGGAVPPTSLDGLRLVYSGRFLDLYTNPAAGPNPTPDFARRWALVLGDLLALALVIAAILCLRRAPTAW
jgi:hypothetical protein